MPTWVIVVSATALSLGTAVGGWRIMHTMGQRVVKLEPVHGFAAETTAATVLLATAQLGMPVSTTHVISSAIMGVGSARGAQGVRWGVARRILLAWVITIPAAGIVAAVAWFVLSTIGLRLSRAHPRRFHRWRFRLLPKDVKFFDLFVADGENLQAAAPSGCTRWSSTYDRLDERIAEIQALEKPGDEIDREISQRLEDAFVTPVRPRGHPRADCPAGRRRRRHPGDRRDVRDLRRARQPTEEGRGLAASSGQSVELGGAAQARWPQGRRPSTSSGSTASSTRPTRCRARRSRGCSAKRVDPLEVIKWRDIYRELENAIDAAEDAAEAIERMFHKAS